MKRFWLSVPIAVGFSLLYTGIAYAQGETPPADVVQTGEIAAKLAGLVAAATVIERIIEMWWDFYENNILTASKLAQNAANYLDWAKKQVKVARDAFLVEGELDVPDLEKKLKDAEKRLSDYLKSPVYVSMKKKISVPIGIVLGLVIAFAVQLRMFVMLDILEPVDMSAVTNNSALLTQTYNLLIIGADIIVTGLVIGTGSAPVHSLIGILQNTKDAVDAARALYSGKALTDAVDVIRKQNALQPATTAGALRRRVTELTGVPENDVVLVASVQSNNAELEREVRGLVDL